MNSITNRNFYDFTKKFCFRFRTNEDVKGQVFYAGTLMFLKALADYLVHGQGLGTSNPAVLIEAFVTHEDSDNEPLSKRRRTTDEERRIPDVTHGEESGDFTKFCINTIFNT